MKMRFANFIDVGVNAKRHLRYRYNEILRLRNMLEESGIPYEMTCGFPVPWISGKRYQICYPGFAKNDRVVSVVEWEGTIGAEYDKLEISGLLSEDESAKGDVCGFLTAEDVFDRISKHYKNQKGGGVRE